MWCGDTAWLRRILGAGDKERLYMRGHEYALGDLLRRRGAVTIVQHYRVAARRGGRGVEVGNCVTGRFTY